MLGFRSPFASDRGLAFLSGCIVDPRCFLLGGLGLKALLFELVSHRFVTWGHGYNLASYVSVPPAVIPCKIRACPTVRPLATLPLILPPSTDNVPVVIDEQVI